MPNPKHPLDVVTEGQIKAAFTYHPPFGDQPERYNDLREQAKALALAIAEKCPLSRERALALTRLEEAVMWANASIARNEFEPEAAPSRLITPNR